MKIVFLSTPTSWGGGENLVAQLMLAMRSRDVEVALAAPINSPMASWAKEQKLPLLELPSKGRSPQAMWKFRQWVHQMGCDVLLLNDPHAITYGGIATSGLGIPRIGIRHTCFPVRSGWKHNQLLEQIICVAKAAKEECLLAGIQEERIEVIYNGLPIVEISSEERQAAAAVLRIDNGSKNSDEKHLLAVGSLLPVKAFDTAIRALAEAVGTGKPWHLWIAGEGPERENLTQLAASLNVTDRVHLLGFRNDVRALLTAADVFVSSSQREGLPLVLIEAMQVGCPVVATPVGGCGEILFADETIGEPVAWTFEPGDTAGLIEQVTVALDPTGDASQRTAAAKRWTQHQFSLERMVDEYLKVTRRHLVV